MTPIERLAPRERLAVVTRPVATAQHARRGGHDAATTSAPPACFDGCDLWQVLRRELEAAALLQWPWSARAMDEAGAAIDALAPQVVLTYAEAGGWGRALVLEARRRGIRSVGVQHGFIYRHWLNYLHEPDELAAERGQTAARRFPTGRWSSIATRFHISSVGGHFPPAALTVTGSARLDELAARVRAPAGRNAAAIRRELGVSAEGRVVVLAAKHSEIRQQLADSSTPWRRLPHVHLVIKVHPAETADVYGDAVRTATQTSIAATSTDLARLLAAADLDRHDELDGRGRRTGARAAGARCRICPTT